jgi:capsid protein
MNLKTITRAAASLGAPIGGFFHGFKAGLDGRWEGAENSRYRNRPGRALESVDWGLNYGVREGLLSEARNLEQTYAVCRRINRQYAKHTIGSCRIKWNTGNPEIDKAYSDWWVNWMKMCDLQGRHNFRKLTKIAVSRVLVDGRIFGQLDRRAGFLQIQAVEGDRVSSDGIFNADRPGLVSGLGLDGNGRAQYAKIWERTLYGTFQNPQEIPMAQLVHVFDSDRIDSVSGVTHYHTVLNKVRDLKETMRAEQLAAKRNSKIALLMKTIFGGAPTVNLFADDSKTGPDGKPDVQPVGDVADLYMLPGEDAKSFVSDRPSQGFLSLMQMMIREIALGLDLPYGVVWDMTGLGSPAVRFEINQASRTFNDFLVDVIEPMWIRPIVGAALPLEIASGRLPFNANWYRFAVPKPKSITIDFGRDSKARISENIAGLGTAADWYGEEDENFEEQTDQLVYEARYRECARQGIPFDPKLEVPLEQIRLITPNGAAAAEAEANAETDEDGDPVKPTQNANSKQKPALAR